MHVHADQERDVKRFSILFAHTHTRVQLELERDDKGCLSENNLMSSAISLRVNWITKSVRPQLKPRLVKLS